MSTTPPDPYSSSSRGEVNPFAPSETLDQSSDSWNSQLPDLPSDSPRIPPIEASYFWAGGVLLAVSYLFRDSIVCKHRSIHRFTPCTHFCDHATGDAPFKHWPSDS